MTAWHFNVPKLKMSDIKTVSLCVIQAFRAKL